VKIIEKLLTVNPYSRPGKPLAEVRGIILHWTGKPWQRAPAVWRFFEKDCPAAGQYSSANYCIDTNGDIYRFAPDREVTYHCGSSQIDPQSGLTYTNWAREQFGRFAESPALLSPNLCTIGIELCCTDDEGRFTEETYNAAVELATYLSRTYSVPLARIGTHHMVVGWKDCPRWWTNHPHEFDRFKEEING
jgi:N-acetylmuramoyl-L-alanine amidase